MYKFRQMASDCRLIFKKVTEYNHNWLLWDANGKKIIATYEIQEHDNMTTSKSHCKPLLHMKTSKPDNFQELSKN